MAEIPTYNITVLIYKKITGTLTEEENRELTGWLSEPGNQKVYSNIVSQESIEKSFKTLSLIDTEIALRNVLEKHKKQKTTSSFKRIFRYAAAILLPVSIALGFYLFSGKPGNELAKKSKYENIKPGEPKAELILASGEKLNLSEEKKDTIIKTTASTINNQSNTLIYNPQVVQPEELKEVFHTLRIPRGGEYQLVLSDGTKVWLNSATELVYPEQFISGERIVTLNGEAYFEVAPNQEKPFIVELNNMEVEVLGTSFNIMAYHDEYHVETTLIEGMVSIKNKSEDMISLEPREQALLNKEGNTLSKRVVDAQKYIAWKDEVFIFDNESLESIFRKLSRWYYINIDYTDHDVKNLHFTGYFERYESIGKILDLIESTNKVQFKVTDDEIIVGHKY